MGTLDNLSIKDRLLNFSNLLREEQRKLLDEATRYDALPNKNLLRQIADLELNITAVDNNIAEL